MPLYYFDTDDGTKLYRDDIGTELADDQAARDEGTRALAEMARDYIPKTDKPQKNISMWVRNEPVRRFCSCQFRLPCRS